MIRTFARRIRRTVKATFDFGLVVYRGLDSKLAFEAWGLSISRYTDPISFSHALRVVLCAEDRGLSSLDLWTVYEAYGCSLPEAADQLEEMHKIYEAPLCSK